MIQIKNKDELKMILSNLFDDWDVYEEKSKMNESIIKNYNLINQLSDECFDKYSNFLVSKEELINEMILNLEDKFYLYLLTKLEEQYKGELDD